MKSRLLLKLVAFGGMMLALFALLALTPAAKPGVVSATMNPLPPLLSCPNMDGSTGTMRSVQAGDILSVVLHYNKSFGQAGYSYLYDPVAPYNSTSPSGTGKITAADIGFVVSKFGRLCPVVDTQIARATLAISQPLYMDILCDDAGTVKYMVSVNCGGDPRFLTEDATFLATKGYHTSSVDVPGQGVHYVNFSLWDGVFNPVRPEGLVYKSPTALGLPAGPRMLVAQLYYGDGDVISWGPDRADNIRAVNTDALPCITTQEPAGVGCGWDGTNDGWHWHENLCTVGIGTPQATITRLPSEHDCAKFGALQIPPITCTFPPTPGFNCNWSAAVGWMGHLWNWLPNANYTNAVNPGPGGLNDCTALYCATGESSGRFADCFPDTFNWNAYNCPQ